VSEPEKFLTRWSRRKLEPADESPPPEKPVMEGDAATKPASVSTPETGSPPEPEFDLSSLPPIDSIGADTDISIFLKPGVPSDLQHAALRRAWATDPAIRDFKGLQDYDWNFNDPNGIFGFGEIGPEYDLTKMVAKLFDDEPASEPASKPSESPAAREQTAASSHESNVATAPVTREKSATDESRQLGSAAVEQSSLQCDENAASQHNDAQESVESTKARRHGGAVPQ